jgi:hypothetical protein
VFWNRFLRRIFGPKRDEVMGEWRKLHNEELHNLYSSPDIGKARRKEITWKTQGVGGKMGSEFILGRLAWGVWIGFDWLRTGTGGGLL